MEGKKALSIQKYARKKGLSFLRFDCRGHGKSYGNFHNFTIVDWKNDLLDMIDNITKGPQILIGSSLGGWLMMLATKSRKSKIVGLIGLAPAADATIYLMNEFQRPPNQDRQRFLLKHQHLEVRHIRLRAHFAPLLPRALLAPSVQKR